MESMHMSASKVPFANGSGAVASATRKLIRCVWCESNAARVASATPRSLLSIPVTWQLARSARYSAGPPEPLATSSTCCSGQSPSQAMKRSYSSTVSQLFWPMSWPNVSRRIVASTSSVKCP